MVEIIKEFNDFVLKKIVKTIDDGGVVCFPTETVYALVADASNDKAVEKIYAIKSRTTSKPLSVLVGDIYQAKRIVHFNERANKIALRFFPGPVTIILKTKEHNNLSPLINRDLGTVGIRMPNHILSLKIIKAIGRPVVGTSANISGTPGYAKEAGQVMESIGSQLDILLDQGAAEIGIDSTIIDLSEEETKILRIGAVSKEKILEVLSLDSL